MMNGNENKTLFIVVLFVFYHEQTRLNTHMQVFSIIDQTCLTFSTKSFSTPFPPPTLSDALESEFMEILKSSVVL